MKPFRLAATACLLALLAASALAQTAYPSKPVKLVVPYPAGGPYDTIARVIGQKLSEATGQPFVVDNRAGAGGIIGTDHVAKSPADGYTLLVGGIGPNAVNASLYPTIPYDAGKDFAPIIEVLRSSNVIVVNAGLPVKSMADLGEAARAAGGKLTYAIAGAGSSTHLFAEMYRLAAGIEMTQVPYRGDAPAVTATLSGETQLYFASAATIVPHVKSGRVRALAVTGARRISTLPDVPTMAEAGFPGYHATAWYGFFAPAGTPPSVVAYLNGHISRILQDGDIRAKLSGSGAAEIVGGTPEAFAAHVKAEIVRWGDVVRGAKIKVN